MMKTVCFALLTTLSLTQAHLRGDVVNFPNDQSMNPDLDSIKAHAMGPDLEFELLVAQGIDPKSDDLDVDNLSGEIALFDEEGVDREMIPSICGTIENLFSYNVVCTCTPQLALALVRFECEYIAPLEVNVLTFRPSYNGVFIFRLLQVEFKFSAGLCANDFLVFTEEYGNLNFGDMCISLDYTLTYSRKTGLKSEISDCNVQGGFYISCEVCSPCITESGGQGVALTCSTGSAIPCLPINLPFIRDSEPVTGEDFFVGIDVTEAVEVAKLVRAAELVEAKTEVEAEVQATAKVKAEAEKDNEDADAKKGKGDKKKDKGDKKKKNKKGKK
jgi:hypothetical protein